MDMQRPQIIATGTSWIEGPRKKRQVVPMILTLFFAVTLVLLLACANIGNLLLARAAARRQRDCGAAFARRQPASYHSPTPGRKHAAGCGGGGLGPGNGDGSSSRGVSPSGGGSGFSCGARSERPYLHDCGSYAILSRIRSRARAARDARGDLRRIEGRIGIGRRTARAPAVAQRVARGAGCDQRNLLANAGLLVRGMQRAQALDPGFDVQNSTVLSIDLPASQYTGPRTMELTRDLLAQLDHSPDLPACGLALNPPLSNTNYSTSFQLTDQPGSPMLHIFSNEISSGYVAAMGMRLLAGRNFVPEDTARDVVVINEAAAKRWWPGQNPLGRTVLANEKMRQIVGVISDVYTNDLSSIEAVIYFPITGRWGAPSDCGARSRSRFARPGRGYREKDRAASPGSRGAADGQFQPQAAAFDLRLGAGRFPGPACAGNRVGGNVRSVRLRGGPAHAGNWSADGPGRAAPANRAAGTGFQRARTRMRTGVRNRGCSGPYPRCWPTLSRVSIRWTHWHTPVWCYC